MNPHPSDQSDLRIPTVSAWRFPCNTDKLRLINFKRKGKMRLVRERGQTFTKVCFTKLAVTTNG